jgi:uncharacterized RDD family membrane protein YckC
MKSIEIKTTQNVTLEYELADLRDRLIAFFIDLLIIMVTMVLFSIIGFGVFALSDTSGTVMSISIICIFLFYALVMETLNKGQSVGKMAMKIQVIKTVGGQATFPDYFARWVFRMIDIYFSFGGIASILISSSPKGQRIGDIVANTAVVKLVPRLDLRLEDLLGIDSRESYVPTYPEAKNLFEEDVVLIKNTLTRLNKFSNTAHEEAVKELAQQVINVLHVRQQEPSESQFLRNVLRDYVVLTR